jgi:hypothetical protein
MIAVKSQIDYARETVADVWEEIQFLFLMHWNEIAHYPDIRLNPDKDFYLKADEMGMIRVFTARNLSNLIGYSVYFVRPDMHYKQVIKAQQDVLFILKTWRGIFGSDFIAWCDDQLKAEGVQIVAHHVKKAHDFSPLLTRLGYELMDLIYVRRFF